MTISSARMIAATRKFFGRFAVDTSGATATLMAAGLFAMIGTVGIATDAARGYLVKARLSQALDSAALAGAKVFYLPTRDPDIQMYFDANFPQGYMDAAITGPNITTKKDTNGDDILTLTASAQVPTTLMTLFGINTIKVSGGSEVTRQTQLLDVVLAIDMSGSMSLPAVGGGTRIEAARAAATEMVDILFGNEATKSLLKIGLVPWNSKVNVQLNGTTFDDTLTNTISVPAFVNPLTSAAQTEVYTANNSPVPLLSAPTAGWRGCVYQRHIYNGATNDPTDDADTALGAVSFPGGDWVAWEHIGPEGEPVPGNAECLQAVLGGSSLECVQCLDHGITPLTSTKQEIQDALNELISPDGGTNISHGLAWASRVLTPGAPFDEADPNPPGLRQQAIVLLTDGENCGWWGDGYKGAYGLCASARSFMNDRLLELATNIKASGVIIYTIQFANSGTPLQNLMKSISTGPDAPYYHHAPDAATLQTVFQEISNHLSELRLSK
ncbi:MAG: VWA domain-containing protein [Rhodospirillaceae bacterium]|nr:VWA domain-containing protein [Rhodospirillaceae bacterium]